MTNEAFFANRVTELRLKKGVSEYRMSTDMGHSSSYIHSIASGKAFPSMSEFLYMCEYLGVTPQEFFAEEMEQPQLIRKLYNLCGKLAESDLNMLLSLAERLTPRTSSGDTES